jgi:hypothetical protein
MGVWFNVDGSWLSNSYTYIAFQMALSTSGAITLAGVLITLAGQFVAAANTVAISGF